MIVGEDNLGGCYEAPGKKCPDVHGYLFDMLSGALASLNNKLAELKKQHRLICHMQIDAAQKLIEELQKKQQEDWAKKRQERENAQKT